MNDDYVYETFEHNGLTIRILADQNPMDPRKWDQLGHMLCWHPEYVLGDEQFKSPEDVGGSTSMREVAEFIRKERGGLNIIPLFLYDHSGITMSCGETIPDDEPATDEQTSVERGSFSSRTNSGGYAWDTSAVGFIYTTDELIEKLGAPRDSLDRQLRAEVDEYDDYLTGNVWGYVITKVHECGKVDCPHSEFIDSCTGFNGDPKYAIEEAKTVAEGYKPA